MKVLICAYLSLLIFSFLFYKLNDNKRALFKSIQAKVNKLNEQKKRKLKITSNIFIFIAILILAIFNNSDIIAGLIIGLLFSIKDICFSQNHIENDLKK